MRLEPTRRCAPRAFTTITLSLALSASLSNCGSNAAPTGPVGGSGAPASGGAPSAGALGSAAGALGSAAGAATGGAPGSAGSSAASAGSSGAATTAGTGSSAGSSGAGSGGAGAASGGSSGSGGASACPAIAEFATWPAGKAPLDIGKLALNNFKSHTKDAWTTAGYAWGFAYAGALQFAKITGDTASSTKLIQDFEPLVTGSTAPPDNSPPPGSTIDNRAFGLLPLEIYRENNDDRCWKLGDKYATVQWSVTKTPKDSNDPDPNHTVTADARYWSDDMFMITGLQVYAYRASTESDRLKYLNRTAFTMQSYLAALQHSDGLFQHTSAVSMTMPTPTTNDSAKPYWGRANGWFAAGMAELLLDLPAGADRDAIMAGYKKQMDGLLTVQIKAGDETGDPNVGMWRQVLNTSANAESSCTAMFTFALVLGLRNGWLTDAKYITAARNGWLALINKTDASGALSRVCPGTSKAPDGDLATQQAWYANIALASNDEHGQAPLLWAADAFLRTDCPGVR